MNKILIFSLSVFICCSCDNIEGSGNVQTENRSVSEFNGIQTSGSIDVEVTNGDRVSVQVEADDNILPYIVTEVDDDLLDVHYKANTSISDVHVKVYITAPVIQKLSIRGSGNIISKNMLKNRGSLNTKISGSGNIDAGIDAPEVKAEISGSGNISLQGRCKDFEGSIGGSGDLKCKNLLSENADIKINGSGTAHVFASRHLKASSTGSGDIYYSGNPATQQINKTGSGNIQPEK